MTHKTIMNWLDGMSFDVEVNGHHIVMDADEKWGGRNKGPRPKPLLLAALSGCSGMDVVSILEKMKVPEYKFRVDVEADTTDDHPVVYKEIRMSFYFYGEELPPEKLMKAVNLSTEQYCGVNAMLKKAAPVKVFVYINDKEVTK